MGDTHIEYGPFGIRTFQREICAELGEPFWDKLTQSITLPDMATEGSCGCRNMVAFMDRFEALADADAVKKILYRVRHGLHPSQSEWAREAFLKASDLDSFLEENRQNELEHFVQLNKEKKDFYGQEVTDEVLAFIRQHPSMLAPVRKGNKLYVTAYPCSIKEYLRATDNRQKRYQACHCPFAKESILRDQTVSSTLCNCSLGHVMNFVEAFLARPLEGRVLGSVLHGDALCEYEIDIPDDVMAQYVHDSVR